jgi:hypothetical protein
MLSVSTGSAACVPVCLDSVDRCISPAGNHQTIESRTVVKGDF